MEGVNVMKLIIELTKPFSDAVGKKEVAMDFEGSTFGELLSALAEQYPKLKKEFYEEDGEVTDYMVAFVNDKPVSCLDGMNTRLNDGDRVILFFPISGG